MIDLQAEQLVPIRDVPKLLPKQPNGKRVHLSAVYRWMQRGVRGGIKLEYIEIGGRCYTSTEALHRFADSLSASSDGHTLHAPDTPKSRQRRIRQASRR